MNITDRATARRITTTSRAHGIALPDPVAAAHDRTAAVEAGLDRLPPHPDELPAAVEAALAAGRDPATDKHVQRALTAQQLANDGVRQQVSAIAYERLRVAVKAHEDDIVQSWQEPFNQAAATLQAAHRVLGDLDLTDTAGVVTLGGTAAATWATATRAAAVIDEILGGWAALLEYTRRETVSPAHRPLRLVHDAHGLEPRATAWDAVRAGLPLALPTLGEYRDRVTAHDAAAAAVAAEQPIDTHQSLMAGRPIRVTA